MFQKGHECRERERGEKKREKKIKCHKMFRDRKG
jgi:hypothetical protein